MVVGETALCGAVKLTQQAVKALLAEDTRQSAESACFGKQLQLLLSLTHPPNRSAWLVPGPGVPECQSHASLGSRERLRDGPHSYNTLSLRTDAAPILVHIVPLPKKADLCGMLIFTNPG